MFKHAFLTAHNIRAVELQVTGMHWKKLAIYESLVHPKLKEILTSATGRHLDVKSRESMHAQAIDVRTGYHPVLVRLPRALGAKSNSPIDGLLLSPLLHGLEGGEWFP